jgi:Pectate lyase superfamily protein
MTLTTQKVKQSGTGATNRGVIDKLNDIVSVKDFGADPTGVVDSSAAFTNAIASITNDSCLYVPSGTYRIIGPLSFGNSNQCSRIIGDGYPILKFEGVGATVNCLTMVGASARRQELRNIIIDCQLSGQDGVSLQGGNWPVLDQVTIRNSNRDSFVINCSGSNYVENGEFDLLIESAGRHGIRMELSGSSNSYINEILWKQVEIQGVSKVTAGGQAIRITSTASGGNSKFSNHTFLKTNFDCLYSSGPAPSVNIVESDSGAVQNFIFQSGTWQNSLGSGVANGNSCIASGGTWAGLITIGVILNNQWGNGGSSGITKISNIDSGTTTLVAPMNLNNQTTASGVTDLTIQRSGTTSNSRGFNSNINLGNTTSGTYAMLQEYNGNLIIFTYASGFWGERARITSNGGVQINSSVTQYAGSGVPSNSMGVAGDYYFRSDTPTTPNQRIYINVAGVWAGLV